MKQGRNFKIGQIVKLDIDDRVNNVSLAKITDVTSIGGIKSIKIIKFGSGYNADFNLTIFADTTGITNVAEGDFEGGILPYKESTNGYKEFGSVSKVGSYGDMKDYFLQDYIAEDYISTPYSYFYGVTQTSSTYSSANDYFLEDYILGDYTTVFNPNDIDAYAILSVNVGAILNYPGFFSNINGSLSNPLICLQDNHLYQNFSYVIQSSVSRNKFSDIVKNLLHPAGMLMFSDLLLENTFNVSNSVSDDTTMIVDMSINEKVVSDELLRFITIKEVFDETSTTDSVIKDIGVSAFDGIMPLEYDGYYQDGYVDLEYSFAVDGITKNITQKKYDQVETPDDVGRVLGVTTYDFIAPVIESTNFSLDAIKIDAATPTEDIGSAINKNYNEVIGVEDEHHSGIYVSPIDNVSTIEDFTTDSDLFLLTDVPITEEITKEFSTEFEDVITLPEISSYTSPAYDGEDYFEVLDGFQIKTP